jgi:hypothetical protein
VPTTTSTPAACAPYASRRLRPFAVLLTVLLTLGTVALGTGTAAAAVPGGPAFGPATTASLYVNEPADITGFIPTGGTGPVIVQNVSGNWRTDLTLDPDGRIHGTPTSAGILVVTLLATDAAGLTDTTQMTLTIYDRPTFYNADTAEFNEDVYSDFNVTTFGYPEPTSLAATGLPAGFTLLDYGNGHGLITGQPALGTSGSYPVVLTSSIAGGPSTTQNLTLNISLRQFSPGPWAELGGSPQVGSPLTASYSNNSPTATSVSYAWYHSTSSDAIAGATDATYTPVASDLGQGIYAIVTVHRDGYADAFDASDVDTIGEGTMAWDQGPHVVGDPQGDDRVGDIVTVDHGTLVPAADSYTYQWFRDTHQPIAGATSAEHTLTAVDADSGFLTVEVTAHKGGFTQTTMPAMVSVRDADLATQPTLTVTGTPAVGDAITVHTTDSVPSSDSSTLRWFRDGVEFTNDSTSYTFVLSDLDSVFRVEHTTDKDGYMTGYAAQDNLYVEKGQFSGDPVAVVSGDPSVGNELTVGVDPLTPNAQTLTYEWVRDGDTIDAATGPSYTLTDADAGTYVAVMVTASRPGYYDVTSWTEASEGVIGGGTFTVAPVAHVVGTAQVGNELLAVVEDTTPQAENVTFVWLRDGVAIARADGDSYWVTAEDEGHQLSVRATTSAAGFNDSTDTSEATGTVTPADPNNPPATPPRTPPATKPATKPLRMSLDRTLSIRRVNMTVQASGLAPRERYTVKLGRLVVRGKASAAGTVHRKVFLRGWLHTGHRVVTLTSLSSRRHTRAHLKLVVGRHLRVRPAATVVGSCTRTSVRFLDLIAYERVIVRYDGVRISARGVRATKGGVYTARFNVGCRAGEHKLSLNGVVYWRRAGHVTLTARR